jgi:hypothetical protein
MSTYDDASLIYYPSGYKAGTAYSLKPTDGSGDLTFTRASSATRVNSDGLIESPRTNLVLYSEDFSNAYWTKQAGITATYNTTETLSPDGTYNATKFVGNGTTGVLKTSISVSGVVSRSVYLKSVTGTTTATFKEPNTNVPSPITLTITNEWQRFEMIGDNGSSFQGLQIDDITLDGIYMWGAQLETGDIATEYIPTTTTAVSVGMLANVPRIDYTGGGCGSLILEPQRTNVALNSETFGAGTGTTIVLNNTASPDGYVSADKLVEDTSTGVHITTMGASLGGSVDSSIYSVSVFVKAAGRTRIQFFDNNQASGGLSNFDLANGVVISGSGKIENYGNGWYRCIIFPVKDNSTTSNCQIRLISTGTTTSYTGDGTSGVFLWGKQIEDSSSYATSYIPTTSTAVTRVADSASKTGISSLLGQTEGTIYLEYQRFNDGDVFVGIINNASNYVEFNLAAAVGTKIEIRGASPIGSIPSATRGGSSLPFTNYKVAIRYKENDNALFQNGVKIASDVTAFLNFSSANLTEFRFARSNGNQPFRGRISALIIDNNGLSDDDLTLLTGTLGETYFQSYALMANYLNYTIQ